MSNSKNEDIEFYNLVAELYNRYGIRSVTMDDVSRELGISKKTLYEKVENKEELVEKVIDLGIQQRVTCFNQILAEKISPIEKVFKINDLVSQIIESHNPAMEYDLKKYYPSVYKKITDYKYQNMFQIIKTNIDEGKQMGLYRGEIDSFLIADLYVKRVISLMQDNQFTRSEHISKENMREINIYHVRGLSTPLGLEELDRVLKEY